MTTFYSAADLARETAAFARFLELRPRYTIRHHLEAYAPLDATILYKGVPVGVIELKTRTIPHTEYPTVFLAKRKLDALLGGGYGVALFMVKWTDALGWINVTRLPYGPFMARGRRDRGRAEDIELVMELPIANMTLHCDAA